MKLIIQDPKSPTTPSLQESLIEACDGATSGGGAFAFVSPGGVRLLLEDEGFKKFVSKGSFDLVVGVDEITTPKSLKALEEVSKEHPRLIVRVFRHDLSNAIFHPKFCWFRHKSGGVLITGSGNLTARGLRLNWEAFTISTLDAKEIDEIEKLWTDWTASHLDWLKATDDPEVLARAEENITKPFTRDITKGGSKKKKDESDTDADDIAEVGLQLADAVLIAEIPKGARWKQANFDKDIFENYFGASDKSSRRIVLQHVEIDGSLKPVENRPGVSVKSHNYRVELGAAAGLSYPKPDRPIAVFIRVASRAFIYRLLMPDDPDYSQIFAYLKSKYAGRASKVRRVRTDVVSLRSVWKNSPFWHVI